MKSSDSMKITVYVTYNKNVRYRYEASHSNYFGNPNKAVGATVVERNTRTRYTIDIHEKTKVEDDALNVIGGFQHPEGYRIIDE